MKNIGFVSAWNERGASYVTESYMDALKDEYHISLYERGSDNDDYIQVNYDLDITHGYKLLGTNINFRHFSNWIKKKKIDILFFNEQHDFDIIYRVRTKFKEIIIGTYIDYYKKSWIKFFDLYDFVICNTKRHKSVFNLHSQCFYVPWGTNVDLFMPAKDKSVNQIVFFHSAGMFFRKGTDQLIRVFCDNNLGKQSKLIIHTQIPISNFTNYDIDILKKYNIEVIQKTVTAPGLYYLGNVYVYPTTLDGLGLTLYEALSSGLPVITTNNAPMNEIIDKNVGYLLEVENYISRDDGYYWPLSIPSDNSLLEAMRFYITSNSNDVNIQSHNARERAVSVYNREIFKINVVNIFKSVKKEFIDDNKMKKIKSELHNNRKNEVKSIISYIIPDLFVHLNKKRK